MNTLDPSRSLQVRIDQAGPIPLYGQLHCEAGQMVALIGPSGAGKTSLLRSIAGLLPMSSGLVRIADEVWFDSQLHLNVKTLQRHVGLVFQNYALMPHLKAIDDVALSLLDLPQAERLRRAQAWLEKVNITGELQQRKPAQLSGGQQQRVALARALARSPKVLLLDEPFSAVDQLSRQGLYELLADLRAELDIPIVLVTHDLFEARLLADQIAVMDAGRIVQQGTPLEVYKSPRNARVADLVGIRNRFYGRWLGSDSSTSGSETGLLQRLAEPNATEGPVLRVRDIGKLQNGQKVTWVIQTDGLMLQNKTDPLPAHEEKHCVQVSVADIKHLGESSIISLRTDLVPEVHFRMTLTGPQRLDIEDKATMNLLLDTSWIHIMPMT
jgi:molybdate transport system ATP-binding protein